MALPNTHKMQVLWSRYEQVPLHQLHLLRAHYTCKQGKLGNIPLLASSVPLVFFIFGSHVQKYFPSNNYSWLVVIFVSVVIMIFALTYHFRIKGSVACDLYLIDLIIKQKEQNQKEGHRLEG